MPFRATQDVSIDRIEQELQEHKEELAYHRACHFKEEWKITRKAFKAKVQENANLLRDWKVVAFAVTNISLSAITLSIMIAPQFTTTTVPGWISDVCSKQGVDKLIQKAPVGLQRALFNINARTFAAINWSTPESVKDFLSNANPNFIRYLQKYYGPTKDTIKQGQVVNNIDYSRVATKFAEVFGKIENMVQIAQRALENFDRAKQQEAQSEEQLLRMELERLLREHQQYESKQDEASRKADQRREARENHEAQMAK